MASHFQVQVPYVLTSLPRPLDPSTGRYVVGEVYGSSPGSKKRKRSELTVGIDGEAVNIYDVSSARLITSYPMPPQSKFSCAANSIRHRSLETKSSTRFTYAATEDSFNHSITLYKDDVDASGKTTSTTRQFSPGPGAPVAFVSVVCCPTKRSANSGSEAIDQVIAVRSDGEVVSLDPETLQLHWKAPASVLKSQLQWKSSVIDTTNGAMGDLRIEYCCTASLQDVIRGVFKGNGDALSHAVDESDNSEVLLVVCSTGATKQARNLHFQIISALPQSETSEARSGLNTLFSAPITSPESPEKGDSTYHLDIRTGTLLELCDQVAFTYDLTLSIPALVKTMEMQEVSSVLRLSQTSLLAATGEQLQVFNPLYRSLQSSISLDVDGRENDGPITSCRLVAYFSRLELAIAIVNSNMVAIKLESPKNRSQKRRAEGLLIDSIGRGVRGPKATQTSTTVKSVKASTKSAFSNYLPGSIRGNYLETWASEESHADNLLEANDLAGLEAFLAEKFGIQTRGQPRANGVDSDTKELAARETLPSWKLPKNRHDYPFADRRWISYAISRVFRWSDDAGPGEASYSRLVCHLPQSHLLNYLVDAGHLTLSKMRSAFHLSPIDIDDSFLAEQLITRLADLDTSLELLSVYISATTLEPIELLIAVRTVMRSLELVQDPKQPPPKLLTEGSLEDEEAETGDIGMEIDDLEDEIHKTELYLKEDAGARGSGLSIAFAKLGSCPSLAMTKALRATFKPEEILSLIYLLRVELVKGAWTSRYLDRTDFEQDSELDAPPDGIIKLIAELLGRCVDSIGPGGWLLNDAIFKGDDSSDFIASLRLEVSAALEGLEQAVYLRGIVGEAVKYCEKVEQHRGLTGAQRPSDNAGAPTDAPSTWAADNKVVRPVALQVREVDDELLPLGLKPGSDRIERLKVVGGGEIMQRSAREVGHLKNQQVGAYSIERISV